MYALGFIFFFFFFFFFFKGLSEIHAHKICEYIRESPMTELKRAS